MLLAPVATSFPGALALSHELGSQVPMEGRAPPRGGAMSKGHEALAEYLTTRKHERPTVGRAPGKGWTPAVRSLDMGPTGVAPGYPPDLQAKLYQQEQAEKMRQGVQDHVAARDEGIQGKQNTQDQMDQSEARTEAASPGSLSMEDWLRMIDEEKNYGVRE